ncbi:S-adenosyl-L-methionine-dependent methyltransferase [Zopfochytrium polystomum]|nr:S-adenosyl-L-methionine-dependent methyltransferase [Zopfochytrium polystomum]
MDDDEIADVAEDVAGLSLTSRTEEAAKISFLEAELTRIRHAFAEYKEQVRVTFLNDNLPSGSASNTQDNQDYYFASYADTEIHETMLKDSVRTESYRDWMYDNKHLFRGKTVLDVGCGTGILSMFAARAGAAKVFAVDNSNIIVKARQIVEKNGLQDVITLIRGKIEEIKLPVDHVDIIISEWMGYFLLFEGMFDSVLFARDRYLSPKGIMGPSRSRILLAALSDEEWINDKYNYWNDVYGFDMTIMKPEFTTEGQVAIAPNSTIVSESQVIFDMDLGTISKDSLDFESSFSLTVQRNARIHALCGWFDIDFSSPGGSTTHFSTGPEATPTHWKQTIFVLTSPFDAIAGEVIKGTFRCTKSPSNHRDLDIKITISRDPPISQTFHVR